MKKIIWSFLIILFISNFLFAKNGAQTYFSMHLGFARATDRTLRLSSGLGLDFDLPVTKNLHFNLMPTFDFRGYSGTSTVKARYLDLPFNIEFSGSAKKTSLFAGAGGYVGLAVKGKFKSAYYEWQKMSFGETSADNRSSLDAGLLFNVGIVGPLDKGLMKFGMQYMRGLKNVVPKDRQLTPADDIKLRNFTFYLAFSLFNKKR